MAAITWQLVVLVVAVGVLLFLALVAWTSHRQQMAKLRLEQTRVMANASQLPTRPSGFGLGTDR